MGEKVLLPLSLMPWHDQGRDVSLFLLAPPTLWWEGEDSWVMRVKGLDLPFTDYNTRESGLCTSPMQYSSGLG